MRKAWIYIIAGAGLCLSAYLFYRHGQLASGAGNADICSRLFSASCDPALSGRYASFMGISWGGWGLIYFSALLILAGLSAFLKPGFEKPASTAILSLVIAGVAGSLFLSGLLLLGYTAVCIICLLIHGLNILLLIILLRNYTGRKEYFNQLGKAFRHLFSGNQSWATSARWNAVGLFFVILFEIVLYQRISAEEKARDGMAQSVVLTKEQLDAFLQVPQQEIPVSGSDALLGKPDAPLQLVVFSDFECPYCAHFAATSRNWPEIVAGKLSMVFKHYPLSNACNKYVEEDTHPTACLAALGSISARKQQKFWEYHDLLFGRIGDSSLIIQSAETLGLNRDQFIHDLYDSSTRKQMEEDIEMATRLQIEGTPAVFLNGRAVKNANPVYVKQLIEGMLNRD